MVCGRVSEILVIIRDWAVSCVLSGRIESCIRLVKVLFIEVFIMFGIYIAIIRKVVWNISLTSEAFIMT